MNIEKFIDTFGDDVYALALIVTKSFDSAERIFTQIAQDHEDIDETAEIFDIAQRAYSLCKKAPNNDKAETLSDIGLSARHEALLSEIFPRPQIVRAIIHLCWENDLTAEQAAKITGESVRYVAEQLSELPKSLSDKLDKTYKELCLKLTAPDALKMSVISAVNSGEKRLFEVRDETVPRHSWTRAQKVAAVIIAITATALICIVVPLLTAYLNSLDEINSSYDEAPSDLIFSYASETEHTPSQ